MSLVHAYARAIFDLQEFFHKDLFKLGLPVWDSLSELMGYLDNRTLGKVECAIPKGVTMVNPDKISIGKGTRVEPGAYIEGPCIIGEGSQVRHGAYVRPYVLTGKRCVIGHSTEVKHSILPSGSINRWDAMVTNPSPLLLPNGTALLFFRGTHWPVDGLERIGLAAARSWAGPYGRLGDEP